MRKILVIEDEEDLRELVLDLLEMENFEVTEAADGQIAKEFIESGKTFDIILSDIRLPRLTGVDFLKWFRESHTTPVVLMSGFSDALETQTAYELGANDFVAKPFKSAELLNAIQQCLDDDKKSEEDKLSIDVRFCKVNISDFVLDEKVKFNVYLKLSDHKFIKLAHSGDTVDSKRVNSYMEKGVTHLYIQKEDFQQLVDFNLQAIARANSSGSVSDEERAKLLSSASNIIMKKIVSEGVDEKAFANAQYLAESAIKCVADSKAAFELLKNLESHSEFLFTHSLGVAVYSVMIAQELGYADAKALYQIFLGGMFHDIGKKDMPQELVEKKDSLLNEYEREQISEHVAIGKDLLKVVPGVTEEVVSIIAEHHEQNNGKGYPLGLSGDEINPFAQIAIVANKFCRYALPGADKLDLSAFEVIAKLQIEGDKIYSQDVLDALGRIVQWVHTDVA